MSEQAPSGRAAEIAVVIPLFNKERRIGAALQSLADQSVAPAQVVVVDDGSTDGGALVVGEFARRCAIPVELVTIPNSGVAVARNVGVAATRCELIGFLDADDEWTPTFVERMARLAVDFPDAGFYGCSHLRRRGASADGIIRPGLPPGFRGYVPDFFSASLAGGVANSSKVVVRKSALSSIGGFPQGVKAGEDLYVWMRLATHHACAFDDFIGAVVNQEPDESRGRRAGEISYPLVYYAAAEERRRELSDAARRFLWRVFYVHFFAALIAGDKALARGLLACARTIFAKAALSRVFLFVPAPILRWLAHMAGRGSRSS